MNIATVPPEYVHAMGNSSGSLSDYWKAIKERKDKGLQGGFIWDWCDQGLRQIDVGENEHDRLYWRSWHKYGGDYGDEPNDKNFNINGMIGPDRQPHPAMHEFKKCVQPVDFELSCTERESGHYRLSLRVFNRRYFSTLDDFIGLWSIKVGGFSVKHGTFLFPEKLLPQTDGVVSMDDVSLLLEPRNLSEWASAEIHLDVSVATRKEYDRVGFDRPYQTNRVATEQFPIHTRIRPTTTNEADPVPTYLMKLLSGPRQQHIAHVKKGQGIVELSSNGFTVQFTEGLSGFEYFQSSEGVTKPLVNTVVPNLFRAATDNDGVKQLLIKGFNDESKPLGKWLRLGLDCVSLEGVVIDSYSHTLHDQECPCVRTRASICGYPGRSTYEGLALAQRVASLLQGKDQRVVLGTWQQRVTMQSNGCLFVETEFDLDEDLVDLPRVGLQMSIPSSMYNTKFFADGIRENYSDRRLAAHAGVYRETVEDYPATYVVPQEQGNRMNMRWL
jgi:beta-galactosidase